MNKKFGFILLFMIIGVFCLAAKKDGIYYVEKNSDKLTSFVKITVKNDKIIGVQYDKKNKTGELLTLDQKENEKYKTKYGTTFRDFTFSLSRKLINAQNTQSMDVSDLNATNADINEFKEMSDYLIEKANTGNDGSFKL